MLQDIEKMKVQYLMSLLFDLSEILQAVRSEQTFLTIGRVYHPFSSKLDTTYSSNQTVLFQITFRTSLLLKQ